MPVLNAPVFFKLIVFGVSSCEVSESFFESLLSLQATNPNVHNERTTAFNLIFIRND